jgi:hypothetical protein
VADERPGEGHKPNVKRRPKRLSDEHMVTQLTRALARERVKYKDSDGPLFDGQALIVTYTRLERLMRMLFVMAETRNLAAVRLIAEIAEGKLARQVGETEKNDGGVKLTDEQLAELLEIALARLEEWHEEMQREEPPAGTPQSPQKQNE